jgi:uncharacterized protein
MSPPFRSQLRQPGEMRSARSGGWIGCAPANCDLQQRWAHFQLCGNEGQYSATLCQTVAGWGLQRARQGQSSNGIGNPRGPPHVASEWRLCFSGSPCWFRWLQLRVHEPTRDRVQTKVKRIVLLLAGWGFLVFGVIGLFLPILQGVLFLMIGLVILSSEFVWAHRLLLKIRERFPGVAKRWDEARETALRWKAKIFGSTGQPDEQ